MIVPDILVVLSSEEDCASLLRRVRWPNGLTCPVCGSRQVIRWCRYRRCQRYMCKGCGRTFNDKTGTLFHYSRLSLRAWFFLTTLFMLIHTSINSIAWLLGVSYMTGFRASKRILSKCSQPEAKLRGVVEMDEVYQTAGLKGRNNSCFIKLLGRLPRKSGLKRRGRGTYEEDKVPVFALIQRGGRKTFAPTKDATEETVLSLAKPSIEPGSTVYTDKYISYKALNALYKHESVKHSIGEYARGEVHINTAEAEFSIFRPFMAVHRGVAKYNMPLYASLFQLHRELRQMEAQSALEHAIKAVLFLLFKKLLQVEDIPRPSPTTFLF